MDRIFYHTTTTNMSHTVNPFLLPDLFFAGRALLTFNNVAKGTHMTVRVKQAKSKVDRKTKLPVFFVSISLLGDRTQGFVFAGTIFTETNTFKLAAGQDPNGRIARALAFLNAATQDTSILREKNVTFQHEGKCCSCGMTLTHPNSIPVGFGPDCLKHRMQDPDFARMFKLNFPELVK